MTYAKAWLFCWKKIVVYGIPKYQKVDPHPPICYSQCEGGPSSSIGRAETELDLVATMTRKSRRNTQRITTMTLSSDNISPTHQSIGCWTATTCPIPCTGLAEKELGLASTQISESRKSQHIEPNHSHEYYNAIPFTHQSIRYCSTTSRATVRRAPAVMECALVFAKPQEQT